jgi:hypothetical protein
MIEATEGAHMRRFLVAFSVVAALAWCPLPITEGFAQISPFEIVERSTEHGWLQQIAASASLASRSGPSGELHAQVKDLRTAAYCRLGQIGTLESPDSMGRVEDTLMKSQRLRIYFWPELWAHPTWHVIDKPLDPIAKRQTGEGTFAIFADTALGDFDLFLSATRTPIGAGAAWTRPLLLPFRARNGMLDPRLEEVRPGEMVFSFLPRDRSEIASPERQSWSFSVRAVERDSDRDGWTDLEEARLGLNPRSNDSDGDGFPDGNDPSPNDAFVPGEQKLEEVNLLQKAVIATFGLSGSRHLLLVGPNSRRIHAAGYAGPVIFGVDRTEWLKLHPAGAVFVEWQVSEKTASDATVEIEDSVAPNPRSSQQVFFRRINNEWIVVGRKAEWAK